MTGAEEQWQVEGGEHRGTVGGERSQVEGSSKRWREAILDRLGGGRSQVEESCHSLSLTGKGK